MMTIKYVHSYQLADHMHVKYVGQSYLQLLVWSGLRNQEVPYYLSDYCFCFSLVSLFHFMKWKNSFSSSPIFLYVSWTYFCAYQSYIHK
jgi:hypothetical protein